MGKNPANYETIRKETNIYEQKPVNIDDFNKSEEAEVKEWVEKQKEKRPIQGWKKTVEKKKEQNKIKEKDMWECLTNLNSKFKDIKNAKKESKKMSETIIN